ncbi:uncharacterized protein LOC131622302 [Vicia villosa]|uniref:uncharacterized protein LOC131622302 n=1 Tax=Vicia villosa TaxID=3911 RepID=UPI00273B4D8F|nr:uncharacterized protein LOC131622302 [Vicia villosa]
MEAEAVTEQVKKSSQHCAEEIGTTAEGSPHIEEQFGGGRLLACISFRPEQCGCADGLLRSWRNEKKTLRKRLILFVLLWYAINFSWMNVASEYKKCCNKIIGKHDRISYFHKTTQESRGEEMKLVWEIEDGFI